jgi:hypothetical protein
MERIVICRKCPFRLPCDKPACSLPFCFYEFKYDKTGGWVKAPETWKKNNPAKKPGYKYKSKMV